MALNMGSLKGIKIPHQLVGKIQPHGELFLWKLSLQGLFDIIKSDEQNLSASDLVSGLIKATLRKVDETPLSADEIQKLNSEDRQQIVSEVIKQNPDWFFEDQIAVGDVTDLEKLHVPMTRKDDETDEEFLARGFRIKFARVKTRLNTMLMGTSGPLKAMLWPNLAANIGASQGVSNILNSMNERRPFVPDRALLNRASFDRIKISPNPIHDTNKILTKVADQIGEMRELAAATAKMQCTLNDTASAAVVDFSMGAESTRKSTRNGLWIAVISLFVSIISIVAPIFLDRSQNAEAELRERTMRAQTERLSSLQHQLANKTENLR